MGGRSGKAFARVAEALARVGGNISLRQHTGHPRRACRGRSQETVLPPRRWGRDQRRHEITGSYRG